MKQDLGQSQEMDTPDKTGDSGRVVSTMEQGLDKSEEMDTFPPDPITSKASRGEPSDRYYSDALDKAEQIAANDDDDDSDIFLSCRG